MTNRKAGFMFRDRYIEVKEKITIGVKYGINDKIIISFSAQSCLIASRGEWNYYSIEVEKEKYDINLGKRMIIDGMNDRYFAWYERE